MRRSPDKAQADPKVSVVMAFFNGERFIKEAIDSVLDQTSHDWELLLVDDGSTDKSTEIALQYAAMHPTRITYLEHDGHENRGVCVSRNLAIQHAKGKFVAFLDVDDVWLSHKLERQVAILDSHPQAAMVFGSSLYWYSWSGQTEDNELDSIPNLGIQTDTLFEPLSLLTLVHPLGPGTAPPPSDLMLRRELLEKIGGFEEAFRGPYQFYEDQAFLAKAYIHGSIFVSSESWVKYRIHPDSCCSLVTKSGQASLVRKFFLGWLEEYLSRHALQNSEAWQVLQTELRLESSEQHKWSLRVAGGSHANLMFPSTDSDTVRVMIDKTATANGFDIQLNQPGLKIRATDEYQLKFRARADQPRSFSVGVAQAHDPWVGLGMFEKFEVTREWQTFAQVFSAESDEDNARIHFDFGEVGVSVELGSVSLHHLPDGQRIEPTFLATNGNGKPHPAPAKIANNRSEEGESIFGKLRQVTPISTQWGFDRGLPIDRYYIEDFLRRCSGDIRGRVLEIEDNSYTCRFGGNNVTKSDVLHVSEGNPRATIIADLTSADHIPSNTFDCIILTQTLHLIFDTQAAIRTLHRILKPEGVLLATFPGITRISQTEWFGKWFWGFTSASAQMLFGAAFPNGSMQVESHGNVLAATSFLHGLAAEELQTAELDYHDPDYEVLLTVRAVKTN